ncbi:CotS family spore coat protein [Clostridium chauvoei]|uniref:CotS family spore coat protein n=2 Tax=Clostridium chauvoei TaxID=46867 RepID=A0ABD4RFS4_9CLOT|nr:CotS family spore coat protein [Clostridium chauvoei]ATD54713.1 spore coat protein CotS [Clostridium chauvoei]ATD57605.1 spore coat protein CotS [Clostridium chauvoei]MBX7280011.1 CotS family spore coat protein [Clostridium chauvoei]MBX7282330.1 CotS family spore coat protein [Clostridium chauvoei]MBX7284902.1 CotS family spore coat protein [Clostridium chauvoei]
MGNTNYKKNSREELLSLDKIKAFILPNYELEYANVTMVKFKDTEKQRAVYKIDYKGKNYCLKKVYYDEANLLYVYSAMEWLYRNSILVPKLLPTINGHRYVMYSDMLFILTPWLEGDKCNFDNMHHLQLSAKTLGTLHKVSRNFTPIEGSCLRKGLEDYHLSVYKHFNQLLNAVNSAHKYNDKFSNIFLANLDENLRLAKLSVEISSSIKLDELSSSLCHGDYVNKNIIIDNNNVCIIDFDKCKLDYSAHDLAYFLRRLLKRENTNWNIEITTYVIDSYLYSNNLTESDLKYILAYIAFPQKYWKLSRDYYKNIKKCNKTSFVHLLEKGLSKTSNQLEFVYEMMKVFKDKYNITF